MVCKAIAWSFMEKKTERSPVNPFTLCALECFNLVHVVVTVEEGGCARKIPFAISWG